MATGIDWDALAAKMDRRRYVFGLMCEFFDRAMEEDNLEQATRCFWILDGIYPSEKK